MIEAFHVLSGILGIIASVAVLYVSNRVLVFKNEFMKELEVKFVSKEVYLINEANHGEAHKRIEAKL